MVTPQTKQVSRQIFDVLTTDRAVNTINADIPSTGTLLSVSVTVTSGSPRRQTYSVAELQKVDGTVLKGLYAGYVDTGDNSVSGNGAWNVDTSMRIQMRSFSSTVATLTLVYTILEGVSSTSLNWTGKFESSTSGQGAILTVIGTNPPAVATGNSGGEFTETVPTGARWLLHTMNFTYVSSASVTNRVIRIQVLDDSANNVLRFPSADTQQASQTRVYNYGQELPTIDAVVGGDSTVTVSMPKIPMLAGYVVKSSVVSKRMADDQSAPVFNVEEWLDP